MTYAEAWRRSCCLLTAVGVGVAVLEWSPPMTLAALALASVCAVIGHLLVWMSRERTDAGRPPAWRRIAPRSLWIGACFVALLAVTEGSASLGLLVALLLLLTSPLVVRRLGRRATPPSPVTGQSTGQLTDPLTQPFTGQSTWADPVRASPETPAAGDVPAPAGQDRRIRELTDNALCQLWRRTFWELQSEVDRAAVLALVATRQACLDELERRNPAAVKAWLSSGATAWVGPERFWPHDHRSGSSGTA